MNLLIDLCGRGSEIARNPLREEHMCLRWEDVQFYTFQSSDNCEFDIRVNVKVQWSKNHVFNEAKYKTIPFARLLPTSMALQDTLRLLVVVAIMDNVFGEHVKSWNDLAKLRVPEDISKTGRRIPIRPEMNTVPVLRRMQKHRLSTDAVQTVDMHPAIRRLGRFCGLEDRFIGYCLRRGAAYILATATTVENRRFLMGHEGVRDPYLQAYQSKISTIDFPAMYRGLETVSVLPQTSIRLNRSNGAPQKLSPEGQRRVLSNSDVQEATAMVESLRTAILEKYVSLSASSRTNDPLWEEYKEATRSLKSIVDSLRLPEYKDEYNRHFSDKRTLQASSSGNNKNSDHLDNILAEEGDSNEDHNPTSRRPPFEEENSLLVADGSSLGSPSPFSENQEDHVLGALDPCEIDDSTWEGALILEQQRMEEFAAEESGSAATSFKVHESPRASTSIDDVQDTAASSSLSVHVDHSSMRLHGLPDQVVGRGANRASMIKGVSSFNDFLGELSSHEDDEAALYECMASWYSITHGIDEFSPGQEPFIDTYTCRFCGIYLNQVHHAYEHCFICSKADAMQNSRELLDRLSPLDRPCEYQRCGNKDTYGQFVACGAVFEDRRQQGEHMRYHVRSMTKTMNGQKVMTCFFGGCARSPNRLIRDGPDFEFLEELYAHIWAEHGVTTRKTEEVAFYEFCQTWLIEPYEWTSHAVLHLDDAQKLVQEVGYTGVSAGRNLRPRLCPFCFHDVGLPAHKRLLTYDSFYGLWKHIRLHLHDQGKSRRTLLCPCYPSTCAHEDEMDSVQMEKHLKKVHGIIPSQGRESQKRSIEVLADITNTTSRVKKAGKT